MAMIRTAVFIMLASVIPLCANGQRLWPDILTRNAAGAAVITSWLLTPAGAREKDHIIQLDSMGRVSCEIFYKTGADAQRMSYAYDYNGQVVKYSYRSNGAREATTYSIKHDSLNRKQEVIEFMNGTEMSRERFVYDDIGRAQVNVERVGESSLYKLDSCGRKVFESNDKRQHIWEYDEHGNVVKERWAVLDPKVKGFQWQSREFKVVYDGSKRPVQLHNWDGIFEFSYDSLGRVSEYIKEINGRKARYLVDYH
jgi:YD repeat-containing protein